MPKKSKEPEPAPPEEEEEDDASKERSRKRDCLLSRKKRMAGYRARAKLAGVGKNNISGRIFSNADVKRMLRFCPRDDVLSYSVEEFKYRRVLSATPVPPSAAQALAPTMDSLARRLCENAAKAAYIAGRPSIQPYDILTASRGMLEVCDFTVLSADGLARFAQRYDHRGLDVTQRRDGETPSVPMMDSAERDADAKKEDKVMLKQYAEIAAAVDAWATRKAEKAAKASKASCPPPVVKKAKQKA